MLSTRFGPVLVMAVLLASGAGCSPKKIVAPLRQQQAGSVSYSSADGKPLWTTTGSAKYLKTVPLKGVFERQPHFTYIVFRDEQRKEDHVMLFEAAGDMTTVDENGVETKDEASLFRVIKVQPSQPNVSVSLQPKKVELLDLSASKEEPRILIWSDGKVRVKYPALLHLDDDFGLDEVKSIKHTKNLQGSGSITFGLVEKEIQVDYTNGETAAQHYAELERVVKPMAPHIAFESGRNWWVIVGVVVLVLIVIGAIIGKNAK